MLRKNLFVALLVLTASILAWGAEDRSLTVRPKSAATERRVALVIGNSNYPDAPLKNPVNDADAMVAALKETGFEVVVRKNADRRAMFSAIKEFGQKLKKSDIGLFYYAGHGVQVDSANYLLPTDLRNNELQDADDLRRDAVALSDLMERMRDAGTRNIVILDACRDNPFLAKLSRGGSRGLAKIVTAANTSILYSTDPGNTASDGSSGDNGVFTKHLVGTIRKDGLELVDVMREVSLSVDRETAGAQKPVFDGVLSTKFYFRPQQEVVAKLVEPAMIGVDPKAIELRYWESAEQTRTISAYKKYLKKYPDGEFADMAIEKVQILEAAEAKAKAPLKSEADQKALQEQLAKERQEQERLTKERQEQERRVRELEARFQQAEERARQVEEKAAKALKAQEIERAAVLAQAEERARQIEERAAKALKAQEGENAAVLAAVIKREKDREQAESERIKRERAETERVEAERIEKERLRAEKARKELEVEQAKLKELQKEMQKGTYTDPKTGLVWLRDGYAAGYKMDWATANDWVKKQNFAGYKGWRLPTRDELMSLARRGEKRPFAWLNANGFKNVQPAEYWTSDVNWRNGQFAVYVDLSNSDEGEFKQSFVGFHVWPVLDAKKAVANADAVVPVSEIVRKIVGETEKEVYTDQKSGLMWVRNGNLADRKMDWKQAESWTKSLMVAGFGGWRLPTKDELLSLVKSGAKNPSAWLSANGFSNVQKAEYWTSEVVMRGNSAYYANYIDLSNGDVSDITYDKYFLYALPVLDVKSAVEQFLGRSKAGAVAETIYTDPETGLMWTQNANVAKRKLDKPDAVKWVRELTYGGLKGWRLPTLDELRRIASQGGDRPFEGLKAKGFHNVMETYYWASDTFPWGSGVSMFNGGIEKQFPGQIPNYVWPVRDSKGNASLIDVVVGGGK